MSREVSSRSISNVRKQRGVIRYHFQYLEEEDELSEQQEVLDQTDDDIATMRFRLSQLIRWTTPTDTDERGRKIADEDERGRRIINRKLAHMERTLQSIHDSVSALDPEAPDKHLVKQ